MERITLKMNCALMLAVAGMLLVGQAAADKPSGVGGEGRGESSQQREKSKNGKYSQRGHDGRQAGDKERSRVRPGEYFVDRHRTVVHEYYGEQFRMGRCPPGLAKKQNGCMPPGRVKKWAVGRPLPRDVIFHEVPRELVLRLDRPSAGYRYVRVASDILLIAIGTGMVIDAIQDLGGQ